MLSRLEKKGIRRVGRLYDYLRPVPAGWVWTDDDVRHLFALIGEAAESCTSYNPPDGSNGGWEFCVSFGHAGRPDPERFRLEVEHLLQSPNLYDLRYKLDQSGLDERIAVLVYDTTTATGWSLGHWMPQETPNEPLGLPAEVTALIVVGLNGFVLRYDSIMGWIRQDINSDRG